MKLYKLIFIFLIQIRHKMQKSNLDKLFVIKGKARVPGQNQSE
jgi:hypothetical protein